MLGSTHVTLDDSVGSNTSVQMAKVTGRSNGKGADVLAFVRDGSAVTPYRVTLNTTEIPATSAFTSSTFSYTPKLETLPAVPVAQGSDQIFVTGGDWDPDSLRLRFTGDKWLALARPRPIVILAAPPAEDGISQNYGQMTARYETTTSTANSEGNSYSVNDKVTLSFEVSFPGGDFISAGASASMSQQFEKTHTTTKTLTYGNGGYPQDTIIFSGTLCTRYRYEIVSGGDGGDAHERILSLGALCWAAAGKDPGYTPHLLLTLLQRRGRYHAEDFARLHLREPMDLTRLKERWLEALDEASAFVLARPPEELGCLYYSWREKRFVSSFQPGDPDVVPHYGRPGGVLPTVG